MGCRPQYQGCRRCRRRCPHRWGFRRRRCRSHPCCRAAGLAADRIAGLVDLAVRSASDLAAARSDRSGFVRSDLDWSGRLAGRLVRRL
ncbi:MAG: hypothetical protein DWC07_03645, partial [Candidatus Poseidoniales archaeon]